VWGRARHSLGVLLLLLLLLLVLVLVLVLTVCVTLFCVGVHCREFIVHPGICLVLHV